MSLTNEEIVAKVASEVEGALADGTLVSPEEYDQKDGVNEAGEDLETPGSLMASLQEIFTLDLELSDEREEEVELLVENTLRDVLPEAMSARL